MAKLIICDICGGVIKDKVTFEELQIFLVLDCDADINDICEKCHSIIQGEVCNLVRSLGPDKHIRKERKMPQGIKRESTGRASHKYSKAMRLQLCDMVDEGVYNRREIAEQTYKAFPHYKSIISIDARISDLMHPDNAYCITKNTKYEGKVATKDTYTRVIRWAREDEIS